MDPRSEVVLRQQDYLNGQVLLINAPNDQLAKNFIEGLNAATSYEGDSNNLYLLYKPASGKQTFRMVFRVVSSK